MSNAQPPEDAAPSCPHDDLEPYYSGSPVAESFAPGMLDETDLLSPHLAEETPWRGRPGHAPDLELVSKRGRNRPPLEPGSPAAMALAQEVLLAEAAERNAAQAREVGQNAARHGGLPLVPADRSDTIDTTAGIVRVETDALRVLVVHPALATRRQVAAALGALGFDVTTCGDADRAVLQVLHERPDAVVAEIRPGELDAVELVRRIKDGAGSIPVVLVAPSAVAGSETAALEAGAADFLLRPITPDFMAERLRLAIRRARAERAARGEPEAPSDAVRHVDRQLRRQELRIQSLFELSRNVVGCLELDELYQGFLLTAMGQLGLGAGILFHLDGAGRPIEVVSRGLSEREARSLLDFRTGLGAYLLRTEHPVLLEPDCVPPEMRHDAEKLRRAGLSVACPMASKGTPVGVALFGPRVAGDGLTADDLLLLSAVCNFAGPALASARLYTELHLTYLSTVRAFVSSLEAKDTYTRGHSERVADYARLVGQACGLKRRDLDMVMFGAMLHDIGKIGVAEGILNKPGALTPDEWRVVRAHPEMGARIVSHIEYLAPAVGLILHHHERIDGRGYPHGLSGDEIEFGTRIVTICDSFDAMTTHRPYRRAMEIPQAIKLMRQHTGRQFDAQIVDTFLELLEARTITVRS